MSSSNNTWDGMAPFVEGKPTFLFGGEIHYFRIPVTRWYDTSRKARAAFLNTVGSYIPWNLHEPVAGEFVFEGSRDLGEWIRILDESSLWFFARPGPYICSEWDMGGLPAWLIDKVETVRTTDPEYLARVERWFSAVDQILAGFLPEKVGNLIIYQVENELVWGEMEYMLKMERWAVRDGITVPIITNLNPAVRQRTAIIDSLDLYPGPWNLHKPEEAVREMVENQPVKPPACIEFQMGFTAEVGSTLPTMVGTIEAAWVDVHLKSTIARGLNFINFYMFSGGTTRGYHTGRRDISSYDYESAIREWGELSDKYYMTRRIGKFIDTFGDCLVKSVPEGYIHEDAPRGVSVMSRRGSEGSFLFPRNTTLDSQKITFDISRYTDDGMDECITIPIPARSMKIVPCGVHLTGTIRLRYTTSQVFGTYRFGNEIMLVVYGEPGEEGTVSLDGCERYSHISGDAFIDSTAERLTVSFTHRSSINHILFMQDDECKTTDHPCCIRIIVTDTDTASRTWEGRRDNVRFPIFSNIYFMDMDEVDSCRLVMSMECESGSGFMEFPCPVTNTALPTAKMNDFSLDVHWSEQKRAVRIELPPQAPLISNPGELTGWKMSAIDLPLSADVPGWQTYPSLHGNERAGFCQVGYCSYRCQFDWDGDSGGTMLHLTEIHDNAAVWLNGVHLGGVIASDVNGAQFVYCLGDVLKKGDNELYVLLESEGRPRKGDEAAVSGLTGPVAITHNVDEIRLISWKRHVYRFDNESSMNVTPEAATTSYDDSSWEPVTVKPGVDSRIIMPPSTVHIEPGFERLYVAYRTSFKLDDEQAARGIILDIEKADGKAWIYCNGRLVDKKHQERFTADLTGYAAEGTNTLVIILRNFRWYTTIGLHGNVSVRIMDRVLTGGWQIMEGLPGSCDGHPVFGPDSQWIETKPVVAPGPVMFAASFNSENLSDWKAPIGLRFGGWNAKIQIWINDVLIGRYHPSGPQELFYIPDDVLKGKNQIVLVCNAFGDPVIPGSVNLEYIYAVRRSTLEVLF